MEYEENNRSHNIILASGTKDDGLNSKYAQDKDTKKVNKQRRRSSLVLPSSNFKPI